MAVTTKARIIKRLLAFPVLLLLTVSNSVWGYQELEPYPDGIVWKGYRDIGPNDFLVLEGKTRIGDPYAIAIQQMRQYIKEGKLKEASTTFQEAISFQRESAPYDELGDALEAAGDIDGAIAAYRQIVYHTAREKDAQGRDKDSPLRDFTDKSGRSVREGVQATGGKDWVASEYHSPAVLMRYCLLLLRAGQQDEAMQAYQWGYEASRFYEPRFEELRYLFDLKPTEQKVERKLMEAAAHVIIGLTERNARTRAACVMPPDMAVTAFKKALSIKLDLDVVYIFLGKAYRKKATVDERFAPLAIEAWKVAESSRTEAVRAKAKELLSRT